MLLMVVGLGEINDGEPLFDKGDIRGSISPNPLWFQSCCSRILLLRFETAETGDEDADNEPE